MSDSTNADRARESVKTAPKRDQKIQKRRMPAQSWEKSLRAGKDKLPPAIASRRPAFDSMESKTAAAFHEAPF